MALGKKIAFLGTGNMAEALLKGLLRAGAAAPAEILCAEPREERRREIEARYGVRAVASNRDAAAAADVLFLSVKPQIADAVLEEISPAIDGGKLVVSIAAGVTLAAIARRLPAAARTSTSNGLSRSAARACERGSSPAAPCANANP